MKLINDLFVLGGDESPSLQDSQDSQESQVGQTDISSTSAEGVTSTSPTGLRYSPWYLAGAIALIPVAILLRPVGIDSPTQQQIKPVRERLLKTLPPDAVLEVKSIDKPKANLLGDSSKGCRSLINDAEWEIRNLSLASQSTAIAALEKAKNICN
jgi:hypothetical protein